MLTALVISHTKFDRSSYPSRDDWHIDHVHRDYSCSAISRNARDSVVLVVCDRSAHILVSCAGCFWCDLVSRALHEEGIFCREPLSNQR